MKDYESVHTPNLPTSSFSAKRELCHLGQFPNGNRHQHWRAVVYAHIHPTVSCRPLFFFPAVAVAGFLGITLVKENT